ncbi:Gfo/Idh/MocA family oxidoreductase [Aurantibacter sp.]|uniref:Gfo/Idh/MocA family protein n=1 Tax=Aurantibacter sp. TaxID=2807103 RepID=UPI003265BA2C
MNDQKNGRRNFLKNSTMAAAIAPFSLSVSDFKNELKSPLKGKIKYALVGTGTRGSSSWAKPIVENYTQNAELVALCDVNIGRMAYAKKFIGTKAPTYHSSDFEKMIKETQPDTIIVTTTDCFHEKYIVKAMELGCDVISEKPLVTEAHQGKKLIEAENRTGKKITTTFNARFSNESEEIKRILNSGELGKVLSAEYHEYLNVDHGASYYRRWHGKKKFSGSLLVHKASHHFDQMNWWLDAEPVTVKANGKVGFYGKNNSFRGENCRTCSFKSKCDFYWDIESYGSKELYLSGEAEDGYLRDGCVWDTEIDSYDAMTVEVTYENDVLLSYSLNSYMPYEGQNIAFNCEKGRLEVRVYDAQPWDVENVFEFRITKNFEGTKAYGLGRDTGTHGGSDDKLRDKIFLPNQSDELKQMADSRAGLMSSLIGIAAVKSIETKEQINIHDLVDFPTEWKWK